MRTAKSNDLADRRTAAAEPTRVARQEELMAIAAARDERREERDRVKAETRAQQQEQARIAAEEAAYHEAAAVAARAEAEAKDRADNMIARVINDEAARKAERDRRYANRKARQR